LYRPCRAGGLGPPERAPHRPEHLNRRQNTITQTWRSQQRIKQTIKQHHYNTLVYAHATNRTSSTLRRRHKMPSLDCSFWGFAPDPTEGFAPRPPQSRASRSVSLKVATQRLQKRHFSPISHRPPSNEHPPPKKSILTDFLTS